MSRVIQLIGGHNGLNPWWRLVRGVFVVTTFCMLTLWVRASLQPDISEWNTVSIGAASGSSATYDAALGEVTVQAAGAGMGQSGAGAAGSGTADGVGYTYKRIYDGGEISAQLKTLTDLGGVEDRVGLMIRGSFRFDAPNVFVGAAGNGDVYVSWRSEQGGATQEKVLTGFSATDWYRLVLMGTTVYVYQSVDGTDWLPVFAVALDLSANADKAYAGVAVTSGDTAQGTSAVFSDVHFQWGSTTLTEISYDGALAILTGSWITQTHGSGEGEFLGGDYLDDDIANKGGKTAKFDLSAAEVGWHDVYLQWSAGADRDVAVPVTVEYTDPANGTALQDSLTVDQTVNGGQWVFLGTYYMDPALTSPSLEVSNTGTTGRVTVDGVKVLSNDINTPNADADSLPDWWEFRHFGDITSNGATDNPDGDTHDNLSEYQNGLDPNVVDDVPVAPAKEDADGDLWSDVYEIANGTDPNDGSDGNADSDGDGLTDGEESIYGTDANNPDSDGDGVSDGDEVKLDGTNPDDASDFNPWQNVQFQSEVKLTATDEPGLGGRLEKTTASTAWNADAVSTEVMGGDGEVRFRFGANDQYAMLGLSEVNASRSYTDLDFAIYGVINGVLSIYESGTSIGSFGSYTANDVFSIERIGNQITYKKNGTVFHTSTVVSSGVLMVDTALYTASAVVDRVQARGIEENGDTDNDGLLDTWEQQIV
ncbi:MAG: hypothetical protein L3J39_10455, partial [Verrucomicrobiales bacterium]|nr:hypothetical protein [Verrucomicrobiales bacterium]